MAKKALCLSGGATRGTFQMGAIQYLYEIYGFRPDVISGTSIGAINGIKLACAPPPAVNDAEAILAAVYAGKIDAQLEQMRQLQQIWLSRNGRKDFFIIADAFKGTLIEEALAERPELSLESMIEWGAIGMSLPLFHLIELIYAVVELQPLIDKVRVEDAVANLDPVKTLLTDSQWAVNVGMATDVGPYTNNLYYGTPLYMATVSLETGKLRYITNRGEFYERDGATPVATALLTVDIDAALDENQMALTKARSDNIKLAVSKYQAAVNQMAAYYPALSDAARQTEIAANIERERQRGIYWSRVASEQIKGLSVKTVVRDSAGAPDPVQGALASASLPVLLAPQVIGVERYVDAGLREIIPLEIVLNKGVTQIVGILCSTPELPEADSKKASGLVAVGMRAATEIAIDEVTVGDLATTAASGIETRIIAPEIDVHDAIDLKAPLIEISMHYGWMRASDEMEAVAVADQRKDFRQTSQLITRLRLKCAQLEDDIGASTRAVARPELEKEHIAGLKQLYFALRVMRWGIFHVAARRQIMGLTPHPNQVQWSTEWSTEWDATPTKPAIWGDNLAEDGTELWPASSPSAFGDMGTIEDAGSDRIYWMVLGALFEDRSGAPPPDPALHVVVPNGLHQFFPQVPTGVHLMAETQDPATKFLVIGGKRYTSTTLMSQWIAAAGLIGAPTALVPTGGLAQIPDGGTPFFLSSISVVDDHDVTKMEVTFEAVEQGDTTVDIHVHNRSQSALNVTVGLTGFDAAQGVSVQLAPTSITANTIDLIILHLRPTAAGTFHGSLTIDSNDPAIPQLVVALTFVVLPLGDMDALQCTPSPLTITAPVGSTTSYATLTVTNWGKVTPTSITASFEPATNPPLFTIGTILTPGAFTPNTPVQVRVPFYPTAVGTFTSDLVLTTSGTTSLGHPYQRAVRVPLRGTAQTSIIRLLTRTPIPADFTGKYIGRRPPDVPRTTVTVNVGTVQAPVNDAVSVFILNLGALDLEISKIDGYYVTPSAHQTFPIKIAKGQSVEVKLDFGIYRAPIVGAFSETVSISCNDPVTPQAQVVVNGSVGGMRADIRPEALDFGTVRLNTTAQMTATFENKGTVDLHIKTMAWRGTSGNFRLIAPPTLPYTVPGGGNLTLTVEFGPVAAPGPLNDTLDVGTMEGVVANLVVKAKTA